MFVGLIVLIVLGAMFITAEYRRGLIHTTLTASPRRGQVLIAKALVIGAVAFVVGAAAAGVSIPLGNHILRAERQFRVSGEHAHGLRVIFGTGALVALAAVLALALGAALRRGAGAVTTVIVLIVVPYMLAFASALPAGASQWLMRVTPAAAFAVEQTLPQYHQVHYLYTPAGASTRSRPWLGLAVLAAYALGRAGDRGPRASHPGRMSAALHAEWTKLRTIAATGWLLLGAVALTVALSAVVAVAVTYTSVGSGQDITRLSLAGVYLGPGGRRDPRRADDPAEYSSGMILVTLTAIPRTLYVLAAKAAVLTGLVVVAGARRRARQRPGRAVDASGRRVHGRARLRRSFR